MQLIGFIHGIGDFMPTSRDKVETLEAMQKEADSLYGPGNSKVFYMTYEYLLDGKLVSRAAQLAASAASMYYAGTPVIGRVIADYGGDIFEYYLGYKTRRDICKEVVTQLATQIQLVGPAEIEGITLVGHSLGSLVLLRVMSMIQMCASSHGSAVVSDKVIDEILADARLHTDLIKIGEYEILPFLVGSPAFSRVKTFKLTTRKMALADSRLEDVLKNQINLKQPMFVNICSTVAAKDPLSGHVDKGLPAIDVEVDTVHSNAARYFSAAMTFSKMARTAAAKDVDKAG